MPSKLRARLTYANLMATAAVFIALGGSSYAALTITGKQVANSSLSGKDVRNRSLSGLDVRKGSLTTAEVRNRSLLANDFKAGQLPAGPQGPQGPQGPAGQDATKLWAVVNSSGTILRGSGVVSAQALSPAYEVIFNRDVSGCSYQATPGSAQAEVGEVAVGPRNGQPNGVYVFTATSAGNATALGFNLAVFC